jgi:16S rRNA G966 N2-methylase RsmD
MTVIEEVKGDVLTTVKISELIEEYRELVHPLTKNKFEALLASIAKNNGIREPIIINRARKVLDGHHRVKACRQLGVEYVPAIVRNFDSEPKERAYAISTNRERRQLNDYQDIELFIEQNKIEIEVESEKARQRQLDPLAQNGAKGKVSEIMAKRAGVPTRRYEKVTFLKEYASEEDKKLLRAGIRSIDDCNSYYMRKRKRDERQAENSFENSDNLTLVHGDFRDKCKDIPDNSVALIFTDPPYAKECLDLYRDLGELAARVLVDGGSLVVYLNTYYLKEIYSMLESAGLRYNWIFALIHTGGTASMYHQQVRVKWKPLLWFVKGEKLRTPDFIEDLIISQPPDKSLHDWAQSPADAKHVIEKLTVESDLILDPFMGSGTTGIATIKLNRKFISIEIDESRYRVAVANIDKFIRNQNDSK